MLERGRAASTRRRVIAARRPLRPLGAMAAEVLELVANGIGTLTLSLAVRLRSDLARAYRCNPLSDSTSARIRICTELRDRALFFATCERLQSLHCAASLHLIKPSIAHFQGHNNTQEWLMRALTAEWGTVPAFHTSMQTARCALVHFPGGFFSIVY
jgi:hypothetical protein